MERRGIRTSIKGDTILRLGLGKSRRIPTLDLRGSRGAEVSLNELDFRFISEKVLSCYSAPGDKEKTCSFMHLTQISPAYLLPKSLLTASDWLPALPKMAG